MTKNEYLVYKELYKNPGDLVNKETVSCILSPESEGLGVSDMAMDQTIKRIRDKLESIKSPYKIITRRGVGYFLEKLS
ncbi:MAG: hypothetical protein ACD_22C00170G0002 [uncultured bacterium]|nr:MAG: hypothetical protein ACD_22C00170G0002 [uncultured bacterium]